MRKLAIFHLAFFTLPLGLLGCDGLESPVNPNPAPSADAAALSTGLGNGPKMVPYAAKAAFVPGSSAMTVCTPAAAGVALPAMLVAKGKQTHLGRTSSRITIEECSVTGGGVLGGGQFTHTSASGDGFSGRWDALFTPPTFVFVDNGKDHPLVADEGTGRFQGISGYAGGTGTIDLGTGEGTFEAQGKISSPGSLK